MAMQNASKLNAPREKPARYVIGPTPALTFWRNIRAVDDTVR
jgi:hypothetical protein